MRHSVLMLTPEPPYPLHGGGAYRIASLLEYFAKRADVDLILFSDSGEPASLPEGLVRTQTVIPLPKHGRGTTERFLRNARRAVAGVPPLVDRLGGHEAEVARAIEGKRYDLGVIEHFWAAPYLGAIVHACNKTLLDLHNVESQLHERNALTSGGLVAAGHRRFARAYRRLEGMLTDKFDYVLATSEEDASHVRGPAKGVTVYPNSLPYRPVPRVPEEPVVVFSGNFEYHPNIDAVGFLVSFWPEVRKRCPDLRLKLVGRGEQFVRHLLPPELGIETTGPIADAAQEIASARIVIAPLRAGSGTRVKIIEGWAAARPVIATSLAAEGLDYGDGRELTIADGGREFVEAIGKLNDDATTRERLGRAGRRLYEERYTWEQAWESLDAIAGAVFG